MDVLVEVHDETELAARFTCRPTDRHQQSQSQDCGGRLTIAERLTPLVGPTVRGGRERPSSPPISPHGARRRLDFLIGESLSAKPM